MVAMKIQKKKKRMELDDDDASKGLQWMVDGEWEEVCVMFDPNLPSITFAPWIKSKCGRYFVSHAFSNVDIFDLGLRLWWTLSEF